MEPITDITIWLALFAGVLSFLSPCTLPIFPVYLSYITGISVKEIQEERQRKVQLRLLIHSVFFLLGVSLVFLGLGIGVSLLGQWIQGLLSGESGLFIQRIAGIFVLFMGLVIGGWITVPALMKEKRLRTKRKPMGLLGTFFVGIGFAAGWTPCIGPIFASILVIAGTNPSEGAVYTIFYIIGFALPFLILTFFLGYAKWLVRYSNQITKIGGAIMIVFGVLLFTGQIARISNFLLRAVQGTWFSNLG
ncbi:cytochrome c biogenesis CcdA family protein [Paraliobacillus sp. JSM ZJ581]|uniref:cytochrome c biogenesis CcdA family protein n=1 Tax=Paraliobacillus sp. JSM ZJ581 TaxID=3342118 RepID=UPI0035A98D42